MSQSSVIVALQFEPANPKRTQKENNTCHLVAIRIQPHPIVTPKELLSMKTGYWPQMADVHIKGMIILEPRLLHLPTYIKATSEFAILVFSLNNT